MFSQRLLPVIALLLGFSLSTSAETIHQSRTLSLLTPPKYAEDFSHFDYVNPDAPKGGTLVLSSIGTFDNFNRFAGRGVAAARTENLYDRLFYSPDDVIDSYYPLIALFARYPDDYRWMEVTLNPKASFRDGSPITAKDVEFSFQKMMTEGVPQYRSYYKGTTVKALSEHVVRFAMEAPTREKMVGLVASFSVFPEKYWRNHDLKDPLTAPPLTSGPYFISDYKMGQYVVYQRDPNYWAADLPVNKGRNNFDIIRYEYFLDDNVALEAFRAGAYDVRSETSPKNWTTQYEGKNFDNGKILKRDLLDNSPQSTRRLIFNITRPLFQDRRVRQAITLAFDFDWMNKAFYYGAYQRASSYLQNTVYEANRLPDSQELQWLTPLKGKVPEEVFTQVYHPPVTDGSGNNRANLIKASQLLQEAGWEVKKGLLVNQKTGQPFRFELLLLSGRDSQYVLPFRQSLARLGIQVDIRETDTSQFTNRLRKRDFDMAPREYGAEAYPTSNLSISWGSQYLDSTYNSPGVSDPAIDTLLTQIQNHQGDANALLGLGRALDRVLTWQNYTLPMWYSNRIRLAYWDKFAMPATRPDYAIGIDTWWEKQPSATSPLPEHSY